jgi:hypothetical protein
VITEKWETTYDGKPLRIRPDRALNFCITDLSSRIAHWNIKKLFSNSGDPEKFNFERMVSYFFHPKSPRDGMTVVKKANCGV